MGTPRLSFHGAAGAVTGSCFRLLTPDGNFLIDCGMFQGPKSEKELNYRPFPFEPADITAVILTHAHIDHSGLLPKLVREGFKGPIYVTPATHDLCAVMLPDSAHIQEFEVEQYNRRAGQRGRKRVNAIYDATDVKKTLKAMQNQDYGDWFAFGKGARARFWNAGHMLGSATVEIEIVQPERKPLRLCFSGDIGPDHKLLHPDPEAPKGIDYLVCESTYGDTDRMDKSSEERRRQLCDEILEAIRPNGALIIPSFAVERAQELISDLGQLITEGKLPRIPVYLDSPLAIRATEVFARNKADLEGGATLAQSLHSPWLNFCQTAEQSKSLDQKREFHIVIAASGMCEAGRVRHRLRNWLWREEATVLLVGYQATGTLGQLLLSGQQTVRIQGDEIKVRARIRSLDLYSGHADGPELAQWIAEREPVSAGVFLVHGEPPALQGLADRITATVPHERMVIPSLDATFELTAQGPVPVGGETVPRLDPKRIARLDWHNDVSRLLLDLSDALYAMTSDKERAIMIRRLRRALKDGTRSDES
ncbi:MBL fold metallo-hydrolase [Phaeobacter sp. PT47_59]|uniref:MBL fold metallo-hydrolase RNA specificity domain-containing protein n=1 Tax=Phaeobacter sp. PT47_59 TaxID=3029979 RepID=UPI00238091D0|nr:MBL fold metallo-hydrolase [Phaeobacter sp. PT47_59]MDE4172511.1 MBL fold metallo-hydrolase [Phaeobacter sp. PT47_59]